MDRTRKANQKRKEPVVVMVAINEYHNRMGGSNQRVV
jgi:hypothetical protein